MTEREWVLELPFVKSLSMNDRMGHWARASAVRDWRTTAHWLARSARVPPLGRARIVLHYVPQADRRRDPINLAASLKPLEDGLVDAKVIPDDTAEFIDPQMPVIHAKGPARPGGGRFWLVVTELPQASAPMLGG